MSDTMATIRNKLAASEDCAAKFEGLSKAQDRVLDRLQADNIALRAELAAAQADLKEAAGEFLVKIPAPGTDAAKMLHANTIMRTYRIPELQAKLAAAQAKVDRLTSERDAVVNLCYHPDETRGGLWRFILSCERQPDQKRRYCTEDEVRAAVLVAAGIDAAKHGEGGRNGE